MKQNKFQILIFICCAIHVQVWAQDFPSRMWHEGWLVTSENDTLKGRVKYNLENDIVQLLVNNGVVKTYNSKKVIYFEIYDHSIANHRQFYSIPYKVRSNYNAATFFEVLYEGELTLLVREKIVIDADPYSNSYYYTGPTPTRERLSYTYFFVDLQGNMKRYTGKKNELYDILDKNVEAIKDYVRENNLKLDKMRDLVRITAFYNSL